MLINFSSREENEGKDEGGAKCLLVRRITRMSRLGERTRRETDLLLLFSIDCKGGC